MLVFLGLRPVICASRVISLRVIRFAVISLRCHLRFARHFAALSFIVICAKARQLWSLVVVL